MAWTLLPTDYKDAIWSGLRKYNQITNDDGTVSFDDVTEYTNKESSFFGATQANRMNTALNQIMVALNNDTDLYEEFQTFFTNQKTLYEQQGDTTLEEIETTLESNFNTWFETIKDKLSTDIAGSLQNQIDTLDTTVSENQSKITSLDTSLSTTNTNVTNLSTKVDMRVANRIYAATVNLSYSSATELVGYAYCGANVIQAIATMNLKDSTPYKQVTSIVTEIGSHSTPSRVEIHAYGTGFVSGHVLKVSLMCTTEDQT